MGDHVKKRKPKLRPRFSIKQMYQNPAGRFMGNEPRGGVYWFGQVGILRLTDLQRLLNAANRGRR